MTICLTLNVFSGDPNPVVEISNEKFEELLDVMPKPVAAMESPQSGGLIAVRSPGVYGRLGFSGFSVHANDGSPLPEPSGRQLFYGGSKLFIDSGVIDLCKPGSQLQQDPDIWFEESERWQHQDGLQRANIWDPSRAVERWLLDQMIDGLTQGLAKNAMEKGFAADAFLQHLLLDDLREQFTLEMTVGRLLELIRCYQYRWDHPIADEWNHHDDVRRNNNCYNFATNLRTDSFAKPGRAALGIESDDRAAGMSADGLTSLIRVEEPDLPRSGINVALATVSATDNRFHCYRQLGDGRWAHKEGPFPASDQYCNDKIEDPQDLTSHGDNIYQNFVGYFHCPASGVSVY